jgi:hypothetical protein
LIRHFNAGCLLLQIRLVALDVIQRILAARPYRTVGSEAAIAA